MLFLCSFGESPNFELSQLFDHSVPISQCAKIDILERV
jgi:hypothetical protein